MSQPMPRLTCLRCGHHWTPQKNPHPDRCGNNRCRTPYWDQPRQTSDITTSGNNQKKVTESQADFDLKNQLAQLVWDNAELTKRVQELEHPAGTLKSKEEAPTQPGDYNCLNCPGANNLGGFYLSGAAAHYRQTGHRLKHIPGSNPGHTPPPLR